VLVHGEGYQKQKERENNMSQPECKVKIVCAGISASAECEDNYSIGKQTARVANCFWSKFFQLAVCFSHFIYVCRSVKGDSENTVLEQISQLKIGRIRKNYL
jgi:hypothetical protein